ncbi:MULTISPECIES: hypothetical protein [Paenibacillus]|uniref:Uncharacterized protein n=1 Tax=Paenibacillus polymyxa TaxID=1406 RepID=A0AAP4E8X7_PAEPO|nr:hypothetical protein [Paenibacillus polymyxa]MDH2330305.1 hypothetical protein [Paenibacillus polymyxa]
MASEKTPNLGLNQIDRTSPKTTYFDLEKYLDQNWRAVDDFAGDVNDGVNAIKKRLDTTDRKAVTLEPGVQIVHAEKASPFSLTGMSGRTLVNLLGRAGSGDQIGSLLGWDADLAVDTSNKAQGMGSIKVTAKNATGVYNVYSSGLKLTGGRYYIALADVKNINASNNIYVNFSTGGNKALKQSIDKSQFVTIYTKCAPANDTAINLEVSAISTATGQAFYADAIRLYEVSASEYAALDSMVAEQVAAKYPYVDSVTPVRNPYAIRYGENLAPHSFYSWNAKVGTPVIKDDRSVVVSSSNIMISSIYPLVSGQSYTISAQSSGSTGRIHVNTQNETAVVGNVTGIGLISYTFTVPVGTNGVVIRLLGTSTDDITFSDVMLNIGSTAKTFRSREDSMLALQTDLYADPVTGGSADRVFEQDGQYFKSKMWKSLVLDGSLPWFFFSSAMGYKVVRLPITNGRVDSERITKFDGKLIQHVFPLSESDQSHLSPDSGVVGLSISSADSGWGDNYTPTTDEIKVYFMGWKMYDAGIYTPEAAQAATTATYNGTGTKYWVHRIGAATYSKPLPTASYAEYTSYQLIYQLAVPVVEHIISEGQLSFVEGDNQIEVGTGIVLRESSGINTIPGAYAYVNAESPLKYKPRNILAVYKNGKKDSRWEVVIRPGSDAFAPIGVAFSRLVVGLYDPADSFSTTYFMTDASPAVPFTGSYAANEKTLLADLVESVQQNTARVSVLENKKADKDNPAWLTPTLLNGWTNIDTSLSQISYLKDSNGYVHIKGVAKPGAMNTNVFQLPVGYRPSRTIVAGVAANTDKDHDVLGRINIGANGNVAILAVAGITITNTGWVSLDSLPPFLAEQ